MREEGKRRRERGDRKGGRERGKRKGGKGEGERRVSNLSQNLAAAGRSDPKMTPLLALTSSATPAKKCLKAYILI